MHAMTLNRARTMRSLAGLALMLVALMGVGTPAHAGSEQRKGTGGAGELRIPVGPRGTALGPGAVSQVTGIDALFFNPAGLAVMSGTQVTFSNTKY